MLQYLDIIGIIATTFVTDGMSPGAIAGIVILCLLAVVGGVIFLICLQIYPNMCEFMFRTLRAKISFHASTNSMDRIDPSHPDFKHFIDRKSSDSNPDIASKDYGLNNVV